VAQVAAWNCTKKALWKQLHSTEQICKMAQNVQQALNNAVIQTSLDSYSSQPQPHAPRISSKSGIGESMFSRGRMMLHPGTEYSLVIFTID